MYMEICSVFQLFPSKCPFLWRTATKISVMRIMGLKKVMQCFAFYVNLHCVYMCISSVRLTNCISLRLCINETVNLLRTCYLKGTMGRDMIMSPIRLPDLPFFDQVGYYALGYFLIRFCKTFISAHCLNLQKHWHINTYRTMWCRYIGENSQLLQDVTAYWMAKS